MSKLYSCYCHLSLRPGNFIDTKIKECINIPANIRGTFTNDAVCVCKAVVIRNVNVDDFLFQRGKVLRGNPEDVQVADIDVGEEIGLVYFFYELSHGLWPVADIETFWFKFQGNQNIVFLTPLAVLFEYLDDIPSRPLSREEKVDVPDAFPDEHLPSSKAPDKESCEFQLFHCKGDFLLVI